MGTLFYVDMTLRPDQDIPLHFLMGKLMSVIHSACVDCEHAHGFVNFGVGFPQYSRKSKSLGRIIRLFASDSVTLPKVISDNRILRFSDYLQIDEIKQSPSKCQGHVQYRRVQYKSGKDRLIRRYAKRHNIDLDIAKDFYTHFSRPEADLPYLVLESSSSKQQFRLYIDEVLQPRDEGKPIFSSYGLTKGGSLPYFES